MEYAPEHLLWDLLLYRRSSLDDTAGFATLSHNKELLPQVISRCDDALAAFGKYQEIAYDIQGLRDEGTDIAIRLSSTLAPPFICIQVKSDTEVGETGIIDRLTVQWQRSVDRYGERMVHYYILVCCDGKKRLARVRDIQAAFVKKAGVTVIAPEFVWTFLRYSKTSIDALVRAKVGEDDAAVRAALQLAADLTPTEIAILLVLLQDLMDNTSTHQSMFDLQNSGFLRDVYARTPDYERDWYFQEEGDEDNQGFVPLGFDLVTRLVNDLGYLEGEFIEQLEDETYELDVRAVRPFVLIALDGAIRYDYEGDELLDYTLNTLAADKMWIADHQH